MFRFRIFFFFLQRCLFWPGIYLHSHPVTMNAQGLIDSAENKAMGLPCPAGDCCLFRVSVLSCVLTALHYLPVSSAEGLWRHVHCGSCQQPCSLCIRRCSVSSRPPSVFQVLCEERLFSWVEWGKCLKCLFRVWKEVLAWDGVRVLSFVLPPLCVLSVSCCVNCALWVC